MSYGYIKFEAQRCKTDITIVKFFTKNTIVLYLLVFYDKFDNYDISFAPLRLKLNMTIAHSFLHQFSWKKLCYTHNDKGYKEKNLLQLVLFSKHDHHLQHHTMTLTCSPSSLLSPSTYQHLDTFMHSCITTNIINNNNGGLRC